MRVVVQRVGEARVQVAAETVGKIGTGLLIFAGIAPADDEPTYAAMAKKVANLRVFSDDEGRMNFSLLDIGGDALVVSQFTLFADCSRGRRPFFGGAAAPDHAEPGVLAFATALQEQGVTRVETGRFGADMQVASVNDGPITIWIDSEAD